MSKYVGGYGASAAKLMIVAEAPGANEEREGIPLVGPVGHISDDCLREGGSSRNEVYITYVVKVRPPNDDLRRLKEIGHSIEEFIPQLWKEIDEINPNCILALGNTALYALTGLKGIRNYRGSILPNSRSILPKVVASLHPAILFHSTSSEGGISSWKELNYIKFDFKRAIEQSKFRDLRRPERTLHIAHNSLEVYRFLDRHQHLKEVSLDIETFKTYPMCIGLAFNNWEAISIPLFNIITAYNLDGIPLHDMAEIWKMVAEFLDDTKIKIIGQNIKFDERRCLQIGLKFHDVWFDTMLGWKTLYPELPGALQFIASILTEEPYYKDEGKEYNPKFDKLDKLLLYNAKDAVVTFECFEKILAELKETGLHDFFFNNVMPLHRLYSDIDEAGILADLDARKNLKTKYQTMDDIRHVELVELVGHEINPNSYPQVKKLLFGELKVPVRKDVGEDTLKSLINNVLKDQRRKRILTLIMEERKIRKTIGTYLNAKLSAPV